MKKEVIIAIILFILLVLFVVAIKLGWIGQNAPILGGPDKKYTCIVTRNDQNLKSLNSQRVMATYARVEQTSVEWQWNGNEWEPTGTRNECDLCQVCNTPPYTCHDIKYFENKQGNICGQLTPDPRKLASGVIAVEGKRGLCCTGVFKCLQPYPLKPRTLGECLVGA